MTMAFAINNNTDQLATEGTMKLDCDTKQIAVSTNPADIDNVINFSLVLFPLVLLRLGVNL